MSGLSQRILVVDDDALFQALAADTLIEAGFDCVMVGSGAEAMEWLVSEKFDLVMVDLSMPQMDGLRLIGLIRATPRVREIPILVSTSRTDPSAIEDSFQVGANDYVTKPLVWAQLPARILRLIEIGQN